MAVIPLGRQGNAVAAPVRSPQVPLPHVVPGAFGAEIGEQVARTGELGVAASIRAKDAQRTAELQESVGAATSDLMKLEAELENDPDFKTSPQRFAEIAGKVHEQYAGKITDEVVREAFTGQYRRLALAKYLNVQKAARGRERDHNRASLDENLDVYADAAAQAKTPEERQFLVDNATIGIKAMQRGGWITAQEAGQKERGFRSKLDQVQVLRDLSKDPGETADRLATDTKYLPDLDPVARERNIDLGLRQAETRRIAEERAEDKRRKERGDAALTEAWKQLADGRLTRPSVDAIRHLISPAEYRQLLEAQKKGGGDKEDNRAAFAELQHLLYSNPDEAERYAFQAHKAGQIKDSTLSEALSKARTLARAEGPRSQYERSRQFVTTSLDPGQLNADPVARARWGLAIKEFDDWMLQQRAALKAEPPDKDIDAKAQAVIDKYSLVNMNEIVEKTRVGQRNNPEQTLEALRAEGERLLEQRQTGAISQADFNRRMAELGKQREAAEKAAKRGSR